MKVANHHHRRETAKQRIHMCIQICLISLFLSVFLPCLMAIQNTECYNVITIQMHSNFSVCKSHSLTHKSHIKWTKVKTWPSFLFAFHSVRLPCNGFWMGWTFFLCLMHSNHRPYDSLAAEKKYKISLTWNQNTHTLHHIN